MSSVLKIQTHFIVSENHGKARLRIRLFTVAEANPQYPAAGYGEIAVTVWNLPDSLSHNSQTHTQTNVTDWQTHSCTHNDTQSHSVLTWATKIICLASCCLCLKHLTAAQVCYPSKESCMFNIYEMREMNPEECLSSHYADAFNKRWWKRSLTGPPAVSHIFVMDNSRLSQSVLSPPLSRKRGDQIS